MEKGIVSSLFSVIKIPYSLFLFPYYLLLFSHFTLSPALVDSALDLPLYGTGGARRPFPLAPFSRPCSLVLRRYLSRLRRDRYDSRCFVLSFFLSLSSQTKRTSPASPVFTLTRTRGVFVIKK